MTEMKWAEPNEPKKSDLLPEPEEDLIIVSDPNRCQCNCKAARSTSRTRCMACFNDATQEDGLCDGCRAWWKTVRERGIRLASHHCHMFVPKSKPVPQIRIAYLTGKPVLPPGWTLEEGS